MIQPSLESTLTLSGSPSPFQPAEVTRLIKSLAASSQRDTRRLWLRCVAARVINLRPDLAEGLLDLLGVAPLEQDLLKGRSIGEIGVCYEALLAGLDAEARRSSGQYFTPDDAASFMAKQSCEFPPGIWMDPCCGVGNLAWHLAAAQPEPGEFVRNRLLLIDRDGDALRTALAVIAADFLSEGDLEGLTMLRTRARKRNFLGRTALPNHDFVLVNPPFARAAARRDFETQSARETFAYFMERIAKSAKGFIAVTPASYLSAPKFQTLRNIIEHHMSGGTIFVYDNVPDTLFRGYKFGSTNTSTTNFVRAAITVCSPSIRKWQTTPILRWKVTSRERMFEESRKTLGRRHIGPTGEWAKVGKESQPLWLKLAAIPCTISHLTVSRPTEHRLSMALTPRYFISAAFRELKRGSKASLYFETEDDLERAALVLNSSIPYLWWRVLDGGVTLPRRVIDAVPVPLLKVEGEGQALVSELRKTEESSVVTKRNAGMENENVKRSAELVRRLNAYLLGDEWADLPALYSEDMFSSEG